MYRFAEAIIFGGFILINLVFAASENIATSNIECLKANNLTSIPINCWKWGSNLTFDENSTFEFTEEVCGIFIDELKCWNDTSLELCHVPVPSSNALEVYLFADILNEPKGDSCVELQHRLQAYLIEIARSISKETLIK
ncbi:hypothetical protein DdX_17065 [Ditylenchus destructor]|uniref:Uncharacterized protein n=1 Tax=Ditylenchus destructor TaxID=166010 RepID=A0AAD4MMZ4_9BILA|nr:hypothetical protein DdX_17065 [Ditylenchus destructor]